MQTFCTGDPTNRTRTGLTTSGYITFMKLYFFTKVQHTGDTDLGQADQSVGSLDRFPFRETEVRIT